MVRGSQGRLAIATVTSVVLALTLAGVASADHHQTGDSEEQVPVFAIDPAHSSVSFKIRHLVSKVPGVFHKLSGTIAVDPEDLSTTLITVEIEAASIDTGTPDRDSHLKSADFFDVEKFPTITFQSTDIKVIDKSHIEVTGDLTMHGVTKSVTFGAELLGVGPGVRGGQVLGAEGSGTLNRKDFGIVWNRTLDAGGVLLGDEVEMTFQIEAKGIQ